MRVRQARKLCVVDDVHVCVCVGRSSGNGTLHPARENRLFARARRTTIASNR